MSLRIAGVFLLHCFFVSSLDLGLDNLGEQISKSVRDSLKPLDNLGPRINEKVQNEIHESQRGWPFQPANQGVPPNLVANNNKYGPNLENLGSQISSQVEQSLQPVRAMQMRLRMMNGVGGITVLNFAPHNNKMVSKRNTLYTCSTGFTERGDCNGGTINPLVITKNEDYCYFTPSVRANDVYCISPSHSISSSVINNKVTCSTNDKSPILVIPVKDYEEMCKDIASQVTYTYYADVNDPNHVQIPNKNPYLKCLNNEPNICKFNGDKNFSPNIITSNNY